MATLYGTPLQKYVTPDNTNYMADINGRIANVDTAHEADLIVRGCIDEANWILLNTAHPPTQQIAVNAAVTPFAGGGQSSATQLGYGVTFVNDPASSNDSLALPAAVAGSFVMLVPAGSGPAASTITAVWPKNGSSDTINGVGSDNYDWYPSGAAVFTSGALGTGLILVVGCVTDGAWLANASPD